ncbi:CRNN protein, partial [Zapornia atra]|nr:CRNN protein [Zapornia atra]
MAQLQENISSILDAVYMCARSEGNCSPLSKEELRQLMEQEFGDGMENPQDPKTIKKVLCFLDDNSNRRVDFSELLSLVFCMAKACYKPLQKHHALEGGQEPTAQKKAGREQPPAPHAVGRDSHNQQVPKQGVKNQVKDTKTQDPENHQTPGGEKPKKDPENHQTPGGEKPKKDPENHQTPETEKPKKDIGNRQPTETEKPKKDPGNHQTPEGEKPKKDPGNHQTPEGEKPKKDPGNHQTPETEKPKKDPENRSHQTPEAGTPKKDQKPHQTKEKEAPGKGSKHHQSPETGAKEQDPNCSSETQGRDPKKTQVSKDPQHDPNPNTTQKLLPPQRGASPRRDPKPQGIHHNPASHHLPASKVVERENNRVEAPSRPAQQQQDAHHPRQPPIQQQVQQSLYQWPPQQ